MDKFTNILVAIAVISFSSATRARQFTIKNQCSFTIWPGIFTSFGPAPGTETGWEAPANSEKSFNVDDGWNGRIWGRTECDFSKTPSCVTGDCRGGLQCQSPGEPCSLIEFNLADQNQDWYDLSNVDAFNLPYALSNNQGCHSPSCSADLNANCPDDKMKIKNGAGNVVGCKTSCKAGLPNADENCCTGAHNTPQTCPKENVKFYSYFHDGCPEAYAYAYDESSGTVLWTCPKDKQADYTITFCP